MNKNEHRYLFGFSKKGVLIFGAPREPGYIDWTKRQVNILKKMNVRPRIKRKFTIGHKEAQEIISPETD